MKSKRLTLSLCIGLLILIFPTFVSAHSGRTDADGGHYDYNNVSGLGDYHYHHGYPAHLHPGGVCPYGGDDQTDHSSSSSSGSSSGSSSSSSGSSGSSYTAVTPTYPESVYIVSVPEEIQCGETAEVSADTSDAKNTGVTWSSDNPAVVKVENNKLTAVSPGTATVTAKSPGGAAAGVVVSVLPVLSSAVKIQGVPAKPKAGTNVDLSAAIEPANTTSKSVIWESSNPAVAEVSQDGNVKFLKRGTATITARNGETAGSIDVTVIKESINYLTLETNDGKQSFNLHRGQTVQLIVGYSPANATIEKVVWSSSDNNVATVDQNGLVKAVSTGIVTIKAEAEGHNIDMEGRVSDGFSPFLGLTLLAGGGGGLCYFLKKRNSGNEGSPSGAVEQGVTKGYAVTAAKKQSQLKEPETAAAKEQNQPKLAVTAVKEQNEPEQSIQDDCNPVIYLPEDPPDPDSATASDLQTISDILDLEFKTLQKTEYLQSADSPAADILEKKSETKNTGADFFQIEKAENSHEEQKTKDSLVPEQCSILRTAIQEETGVLDQSDSQPDFTIQN